jgi:hypothetical protein
LSVPAAATSVSARSFSRDNQSPSSSPSKFPALADYDLFFSPIFCRLQARLSSFRRELLQFLSALLLSGGMLILFVTLGGFPVC